MYKRNNKNKKEGVKYREGNVHRFFPVARCHVQVKMNAPYFKIYRNSSFYFSFFANEMKAETFVTR